MTKPRQIARDLILCSGRVAEPTNRNEQLVLHEELHMTGLAADAAFADRDPEWWLRIADTDSLLIVIGDDVVIARSPERGTVVIDYIGPLRGGTYRERWHDGGDRVELTFQHKHLPKPIVLVTGAYGIKRYADARAAFRRWAQPAP